MRWQDWIEQRPEVMTGKPVFKGTRLPVEMILQRLGEGVKEGELLTEYPRLKEEHVRAAQAYAAAVLSSDEVVFTDGRAA